MTPNQIVELKITILNLYAAATKDPNAANKAILNAAHKELFTATGEVFSLGKFVKMPTVTLGASLNGRVVSSTTVPNDPQSVERAKRVLQDSFPEALICRKL
jgi:hypothetical protein